MSCGQASYDPWLSFVTDGFAAINSEGLLSGVGRLATFGWRLLVGPFAALAPWSLTDPLLPVVEQKEREFLSLAQ